MLPPCKLSTLRAYSTSIGYTKVERLTNSKRETWVSPDNYDLVRFPVDEDPMAFDNLVAVIEIQLKGCVGQIPYYAKLLSQQFDAEGHGPSC